MFFSLATVVLSVAAAASAQKTINVNVGENNSLMFNPSSIQAAVGDTVVFNFLAKNHTVTQSTFTKPCEVMTSPMQGIDSGFVPVDPNSNQIPTWSFEINNASTPLWFFCRQTNHCKQGMVFAINPTADKTFDQFSQMAKGGVQSASTSSSSSSSSSMSSSTMSMTSSGFITSTSASASATSTGSASTTGTSTSASASATSSGSAGRLSSSAGLVGVVALIAGAIF